MAWLPGWGDPLTILPVGGPAPPPPRPRSGHAAWLWPLLTAATLLALAVVIHMADELREGESFAFDAPILLALRTPGDLSDPVGPVWLTQAFIDITALGGFTLRWLFGAAAIGFLIDIRRRVEAAWLAASLVGSMLLNTVLKIFLDRPRPDIVPHLADSSGSSFPSGHAMVAAAVYLTIGVMLAETQARMAVRAYLMIFFSLVVVLIGASRVYLGVHWPSDVLAGWAVGAAWAFAVFAAKRWWDRRKPA
jgi:undecaprenyl-diphosphatase